VPTALNQGASALSSRLERIRARIADAARRAGRDPGEVELLAVVKLVADADVEAAIDLGLLDLAENRVQNLLARPESVTSRARMHLIGPLQTNKVRKAVAAAAEFHALDRLELVPLLERESATLGKTLPVWVEVNVAREPQKHGVEPEACAELVELTRGAAHLALRGLMTIAPLVDDPELARPHFRELAALSRRLREQGVLPDDASGLSMGMSNDFEAAIEEGATVVRLGSALFREDDAC
jgi:pyridoxal phosphate enzyme (YggS family)